MTNIKKQLINLIYYKITRLDNKEFMKVVKFSSKLAEDKNISFVKENSTTSLINMINDINKKEFGFYLHKFQTQDLKLIRDCLNNL